MFQHLIIARFQNNALAVLALDEKRKPDLFYVIPDDSDRPVPGTVYAGCVENIHSESNAAFVRIGKGGGDSLVYLPLEQNGICGQNVMAEGTDPERPLRAGDRLLVRIDKAAMKGKKPHATGEIQIAGSILAATTRGSGIRYSHKLSPEFREKAGDAFSGFHPEVCLIVRTAAENCAPSELRREAEMLQAQLGRICREGITRSVGTCVYRPLPLWMELAGRIARDPACTITTDSPAVFAALRELSSGDDGADISLYGDEQISLAALYSVPSLIDRLTRKKVNLKSGASIIIEQTEAFCAIDVNSGKKRDKRGGSETELRINLEAADAAFRQIRLRSLSGTILIDFINMEDESHRSRLMDHLRTISAEDIQLLRVVDLTALQIAEITREKKYPFLSEQLRALRGD